MAARPGLAGSTFRRFLTMMEPSPSGCWLWTGARAHGYGRFYWKGGAEQAHRVAYILFVGDPTGMQVHHECRNRACVNPTHLELLSIEAHASEHWSGERRVPDGSRCKNGHVVEPGSYRIEDRRRRPGVSIVCRQCERDRVQRWKLRNPESYAASVRRSNERRKERLGRRSEWPTQQARA